MKTTFFIFPVISQCSVRLSSPWLQKPFHVSYDLGACYFIQLSFKKKTLDVILCLYFFSSPADPVQVSSEEEDAHFSRLLFKDDFLSDQYFGDSHPISMITEKEHFGEGMHRRAFRTKLHAGQIPLLLPGHSCVLKVHNAISYGTKNNDELVQKNFTLAVEVRISQLVCSNSSWLKE